MPKVKVTYQQLLNILHKENDKWAKDRDFEKCDRILELLKAPIYEVDGEDLK